MHAIGCKIQYVMVVPQVILCYVRLTLPLQVSNDVHDIFRIYMRSYLLSLLFDVFNISSFLVYTDSIFASRSNSYFEAR